MGIDCTVNEEVEAPIVEFPVLVIWPSNCVVLMIRHGEGTVLNQGATTNPVGFHSTQWNLSGMTRLRSSVTLSNTEE